MVKIESSSVGQFNSQSDVKPRFGQVMLDLRKREKLSQRKLAAILRVDESTIARIEGGTRKPPRDPEFYQRWHSIPGITDGDIGQMLDTEDVPRWMSQLHNDGGIKKPATDPNQAYVSFRVGASLKFEVDASIYSPDETERIRELVKQVAELSLRTEIIKNRNRSRLVKQSLDPLIKRKP